MELSVFLQLWRQNGRILNNIIVSLKMYILRLIHHICSICEAKVGLGGRVGKMSIKYRREGYTTVNKLYLADREMDKLFNEDR